MKRRKKKGSSIVMVIAIFSILIIVGIAILGAVTASYKLRVEENNKIKNLYGAESGIDEAYVRMYKVVGEAIQKGIEDADTMSEEYALKDRNDEFKRVFSDFITSEITVEDKVKKRLEKEIEEISDENKKVEAKLSEKANTDNLSCTITSTFTDKKNKSRTVRVDYTIEIPDSYKALTTKDGELNNIINYSLATDENLKVSGKENTKTNIQGNVWVKGVRDKENNKIDIVTGKYVGGITLDKSNIIFDGKVNTSANISVDEGADVKFKNEVYAENILLGNVNFKDNNRYVKVSAEDLNVANDLVMSCNDGKCEINNLYAFNDLNVDKVRSSSSIIINSMNWPKCKEDKNNDNHEDGHLIVKDQAYIMGAAYINTKGEEKDKYQTGESVAYKGNYKAYSTPVEGEYETEKFSYVNPLMLITEANGKELSLADKAAHIEKYSKAFKLRTEGIKLPEKTSTVGAYISDGKVIEGKPTQSLSGKKKDFVREVYNMGINLENFSDGSFKEEFTKGQPIKTVSNQINWDGVDTLIKEKGNVIDLSKYGIMVILNNTDKVINITEAKVKLGEELLKDINKKCKKYIVISSGPVRCNYNNEFNGMVVSKKNIEIVDTVNIGTTLTQEEINSEENRDVLNLIFGAEDYSFIEKQVITPEGLIETGKWTLVK